MNRVFVRKTVFLALIFVISGCASLDKKLETIKPTAELIGARVADINFDQVDMIFDVAVENKNPFSFKLAGLDYDLKVADQSLISGITGKGLKIKKSSTSKIALPVTLKFDDLKKLPGKVWEGDFFSYQLDSSINVNLPVIGNYSVPFSRSGELPVPKVPKISLKDVKVKDLSFSSAEVVARIEVDNPNAFNLDLSQFNYELEINNQTWGKGASNLASSIPEKGTGTIDIPLELNLLSMGKAAYSLLKGNEEMDYKLLGGVTLDTGLEFLKQYDLPLDIKGKTSFR